MQTTVLAMIDSVRRLSVTVRYHVKALFLCRVAELLIFYTDVLKLSDPCSCTILLLLIESLLLQLVLCYFV